jgi:hypothetical protein
MKTIYIAGPMSGIPEFNFPAFYAAEEFLKDYYDFDKIWNPAKKDIEKELNKEAFAAGDHVKANATGFDFREAYLWDVQKVIESSAIYMLKGWEKSPGAVGEHAVAVACQKHDPSYEIIYE